MGTPHIIGIAGGSCSGKTTLAHRLAERLGGAAAVVPIDAYYRGLADYTTEERARYNFDAPDAIEHELLEAQLSLLARGEAVERPTYDYALHVRALETRRVEPTEFIVVEGLFALYWERVRASLATRIFVEARDEVCLARRVERDVRERGRTPDSVARQYAETVRPMYVQFCAPTRSYADLVLDGERPLDLCVERALKRVLG